MVAKYRFYNWVLVSTFLICSFSVVQAQILNDNCETATLIPNVTSDAPFIKIQGNTFGALPEGFENSCFIGSFPTVWYQLQSDNIASLINIQVTSNVFNAPAFSLFHLVSDCSALEPVTLTQIGHECIMGSNGVALAIGTEIQAGEVYYIAVSSPFSAGGDFELSVNTISVGSKCVVSRNIEITSRSSGGPLTGPFYPGETIGVCMNVDSFTGFGNGCQWFQGLVPVFGNGWDPSSFESNGQPLNSTINGLPIGQLGNGLYGTSNHDSTTWDWFTDVGHHFDNAFFQINDFDGNGTLDICHSLYEPNCPDLGGITGGCCFPCWDDPGDLLPPGWFAYGINGNCPIAGPPISKDWGDGNTCSCCMGPWKFCFDLVIRDFPDCSEDSTTMDLSIGFFTFSDFQTGAAVISGSVCVLDQPMKIILPFCCNVIDTSSSFLSPICSGDVVHFDLNQDSVKYWIWTANFENVTGANNGSGGVGSMILDTLLNTGDSIEFVTYTINGFANDPCPVFEESVSVQVRPGLNVELIPDQPSAICEGDTLFINSEVTGGQAPFTFEWTTPVGPISGETIMATEPGMYSLNVGDSAGCIGTSDTLMLEVNPNPDVDLGPDTITVDSLVILDAENPGASFLWNTGDTTQFLIINSSGLYSVIVTDSLGCNSSDSVYVLLITSVSNEIRNHIYIFPNPNDGVFTINGDISSPDYLQIKVINTIGREVYISKQELLNSGFSKSFDIHDAGRGIYFLQIYLGKELIVKKIIVE